MIIVTRVDWTIGPEDCWVENYMGVLGVFESYDEAKDAIRKDLDTSFDPTETFVFAGGEAYCDLFDHVGLRYDFKPEYAPDPDPIRSRLESSLMDVTYYCTEV